MCPATPGLDIFFSAECGGDKAVDVCEYCQPTNTSPAELMFPAFPGDRILSFLVLDAFT